MTDPTPKRSLARWWPLFTFVGALAFGGGALAALSSVTRSERELAAITRLRRRTRALVEHEMAETELACDRTGTAAVVSATLQNATTSATVEDGALVRLEPAPGAGQLPATRVEWARVERGVLATAFDDSQPPGERALKRQVFEALGDLVPLSQRAVSVPWVAGARVESDVVHAPRVTALYVASPRPTLVLRLVDEQEPVLPLLEWWRQGSGRGDER